MEVGLESQRQLVDLQYFESIIKELEFNTGLFPIEKESNVYFIHSDIGKDHSIQLMYIPTADLFEETNFLQFYGICPHVLNQTKEVDTFLAHINPQCPIGHLGISEDRKLYLRYVYSLSRFMVPPKETFLEVFLFFAQVLAQFGETISRLSEGEISLEKALEEFQ